MENEGEFPSASFVRISDKIRITPIIITILVLIIIFALVYLALYFVLQRRTPCEKAPTRPQNVIAGYIDRRTFGIAWDKVANADTYIVRIGETPEFENTNSLAQFETDQLQFNVKDLEAGKTYYIRVAAKNSCGLSSDSSGITYIFVEA